MIKLAICDDEKAMCQALYSLSLEWFANHDIEAKISEFYDGESLVSAYEKDNNRFDILLLDIKMKNLNGISAAKLIRRIDEKVLIVFITSSVEYVFRGYEVKAFRYILKKELETSFEKVLRDCIEELKPKESPVFAFKSDRDDYRIPLSDIIYFESEKRIVKLHTNDEDIPFYDKLSAVEQRLEKDEFVRIHQSFLVNPKWIKSINGLTLILKNGTSLPISKSKLKSTKDAYLWSLR